MTKAVNKRIPGIKNLSGIEILLKYVKARSRTEIAKKPEITYSRWAKALCASKRRIEAIRVTTITFIKRATLPLIK
jgi:hypothetical protein